jgi:hypothetical protein
MHTCIHAYIHTYILIHYINLYMFLLSLCDICFPLWILCLFISVWLWEFPWLMDDLGTPRNRLEHLGISWAKSTGGMAPSPAMTGAFPAMPTGAGGGGGGGPERTAQGDTTTRHVARHVTTVTIIIKSRSYSMIQGGPKTLLHSPIQKSP